MRALIIGGGLLGTLIAQEVAQALPDAEVTLLRLPDHPRPQAETLRNQAWLQSGLHYVGGGVECSRRFLDASLLLQDAFGLEPERRGVMKIPDNHEERFAKAADALRLSVRKLEEGEIRALLGPFARELAGGVYYDVPDTTFPEATIIHLARQEARSEDVRFIEVSEPITLRREDGRIVAYLGDSSVDADEIILAAGCGTPALLAGAEISAELEAERTALLVVKQPQLLCPPVLADRVAKYAVTQPKPGRLVFAGQPTGGVVPSDNEARRVSSSEAAALLKAFENACGIHLGAEQFRCHVGYEIFPCQSGTETLEQKIRRKVEPVVRRDHNARLTWALPGRATMALSVAQQVVGLLEEAGAAGLSNSVKPPTRAMPAGRSWDTPIEMYFSEAYDASHKAQEERDAHG